MATSVSARRWRTAWNLAIGRPNWTRSRACSRASSSIRRLCPTSSWPTASRARSDGVRPRAGRPRRRVAGHRRRRSCDQPRGRGRCPAPAGRSDRHAAAWTTTASRRRTRPARAASLRRRPDRGPRPSTARRSPSTPTGRVAATGRREHDGTRRRVEPERLAARTCAERRRTWLRPGPAARTPAPRRRTRSLARASCQPSSASASSSAAPDVADMTCARLRSNSSRSSASISGRLRGRAGGGR